MLEKHTRWTIENATREGKWEKTSCITSEWKTGSRWKTLISNLNNKKYDLKISFCAPPLAALVFFAFDWYASPNGVSLGVVTFPQPRAGAVRPWTARGVLQLAPLPPSPTFAPQASPSRNPTAVSLRCSPVSVRMFVCLPYVSTYSSQSLCYSDSYLVKLYGDTSARLCACQNKTIAFLLFFDVRLFKTSHNYHRAN